MYQPKGRRYKQVQCLRDITGNNFPNGQIRFNWNIPSGESWNPYLSYYKMRHSMESVDVAQKTNNVPNIDTINTLTEWDASLGVSPVMFFQDSLWQDLEFRINGQSVCKQSDYVHQIASLKHRLKGELQNKNLNALNFHSPYSSERATQFSKSFGGYSKSYYQGPKDVLDLMTPTQSANPHINFQHFSNVLTNIVFTNTTFAPVYTQQIKQGDWVTCSTGTVKFTHQVSSYGGNYIRLITPLQNYQALGAAIPLTKGMVIISARSPSPLPYKEGTHNKNFETIWRPRLGIFDIDKWLPGGQYEMILTPNSASSYINNAWTFKSPNVSKINYNMLTMDLNICVCNMASTLKSIEFMEICCQAKTLNTYTLSQKQFTVKPKSKHFTIAYQDNKVYSSSDLETGIFKITNNHDNSFEKQITRHFINFDGSVLPNPIPSYSSSLGATDFWTQQYWNSQHAKLMLYRDIEPIDVYHKRGPYWHYTWPRQNSDANSMQISQEFSSSFDATTRPQLLLFEHYLKKFTFQLYQGHITSVKQSF